MSTKVIVGLNIVFSIIVLVLWQKYSEAISRWETDHAVQEMALAQARMTATAQFKAIMATGTVEAAADKAIATVEAKADKATATAVTKKISDLGNEQQHTEQKYQETLAQKLGAEAALRLNDEADPTLGTLLAAESVRRYQAVEGDIALRRSIELLSWKPIFQAKVDGCIYNYRFDPEGEWIAVVSGSCRYRQSIQDVIKWEVNTGQPVITLTQHDLPSYVVPTISRDGQQLIAQNDYKELDRIDIKTRKMVFTLPITGDWAFSRDEQKLALEQPDKHTVKVLDAMTKQPLYQVTHVQEVRQVNFSPTGQWLVTSDIGGTVWLWDAQTGQAVKNFPHEREENEQLFLTMNEQMIGILNVKRGLELWDIATVQPLTPTLFNTEIGWDWSISPDGQWLATVDERWEFVRIWATATGQEVTRLAISVNKKLHPVTFSPDGQWLVIGENYGVTRIWQTGTWQEVARPFAKGVDKATFSADGKRLALISSSRDSENFSRLSVWEKQDILATPSLSIHELDPYGYYSSLIYISTAEQTNKIAFSPDRKIFAAINDDRHIIEIKNEGNKMKLREIDLGKYYLISKMAFSPDGQWLVTTSLVPNTEGPAFGGTQIWEVATGRLIMNNDEPNENLAFSPNSQWLMTNGGHVWEIATGREVARLENLMDKETAFSPDNRYILSAENGTVNQWPWQPDDMVAVACQRLSRNLTEAEWRLYLGDEPYRKTCPNL